MRNPFSIIVILLYSAVCYGQDAGVTALNSPNTGCVLTSNETVEIDIFNFGPDIVAPFDVSYTINAGPPVTETVTTLPILSGNTLTFSFTTTANLATPGTYVFDAYTSLPGDVDLTNDTLANDTVINYSLSVGGSVGLNATVCAGMNAGILNLTGHTGTVLFWEFSTDGGVTWNFIPNTTTSQSYLNLVTTTMYRVLVRNGGCPPAFSTPATITVVAGSVGGTINSSTNVCVGSNSGTLALTGESGNVLDWEFSTDGGLTWTSLGNTTTSQNYTNLLVETWYQAIVELAPCPTDTSSIAIITMDVPSVGGTVTADATVCSGSNSGTLTLAGETGSVINWEFSTDGGVTWNNIVNTTNTQNYTNITNTTLYRAVVQNGACPSAPSSFATITVDAVSNGGTVNSDANECFGSNSGTLALTGETGLVLNWEFSVDGGLTWTNIANTTTSQNYLNLTVTTMYRAVVQNGVCPPANSIPATITIDPTSVGGTVTADATVCSGSNSGTLTLVGETGSVTNWEFSTDGGLTWNNIANTTNTQNYTNLTTTTLYRAVVQSGTCPAATSTFATITVDVNTVGGTVTSDANVCSGSNSGTLTLAGETGVVQNWQFSTDGGLTWTNIVNTTNTQNYTNLIVTTMYQAVVQSGVCPADSSVPATITVDAVSVGGTVTADASVCSGTNSGTLTLAGETGSVLNWEFSIDGGLTWTPIVNTTNTQNYTNLTTTTLYRAVVQNGVCPSTTSGFAAITVTTGSVGGTVNSSTNVCFGSNSGTLTLTGETGSVLDWEFSTDGGLTWNSLGNITTSQAYNNITLTTDYRAIVQFGTCPPDTSTVATLTVDPATVAGTLASDMSVCAGINAGTLTLAGEIGSILDWEFSTDGGITWNSIGNTTNTENFSNLLITTQYRVIVQSGVCPQAISNVVTVTVTPPSVGGSIAANTTVCSGSNSGTLTLSGESGSILNWESSTDGGLTWTNIANTTNTENYTNLIITTWYRAIVQLGVCATDTSTIAIITVDPVSVGGTVNGSTTVCAGTNTDTLIVTGHVGTIIDWESSMDNGTTWVSEGNTSDTLIFNNLIDTTWYRVIVQSGVCPPDTSTIGIVDVDQPSVAGTIAGSAIYCGTINNDTLFLNGFTGSISYWEESIDNGITWNNIAITSDTLEYINVPTTTWYRAVIQSGVCSSDTSDTAVVQIDPIPIGGNILGGTTVCLGSPDDTLFLSGFTGNVLFWESSDDNGVTWINVPTPSDTLVYSGLIDTTWFRAIVASGICPLDTSDTAIVNVDFPSIGGTISGSATYCGPVNNDSLFLSGYNGSILYWESSIDSGLTWITIPIISDTLEYINVSTTTWYRTIVQNGTCPTDTSDTATVAIDPISTGGNVLGSTTVCLGSGSDTLFLSGFVGSVLFWESSNDSGVTWTNIPVTSDTLVYSGLTDTTWFRAVVLSGVCSQDTSDTAIVNVDIPSVGGIVMMDTIVCIGMNNDTLFLTGYTGGVLYWESSIDGGATWNTIASTSDTLPYTNVTFTTMYRAIVQNGVCTPDTSSIATLTVSPLTAGGTVTGSTSVCEGFNNGSLTLAGNVGNVLYWETSTDSGLTWTNVPNTTTVIGYNNLTDTTWYRAIVQSGTCPIDTSSIGIITILPSPVSAFTVSDTCLGIPIQFMNQSTISSGLVQFTVWDFGDFDASVAANPFHLYADSGAYNVSLVAISNFGCMDTAYVTLTIFPLPSSAISLDGPPEFCDGNSVTLSVDSGNLYLWSTGSTDTSLFVDTTGTYSIVVTDTVTGCTSSDSVDITSYPLPAITVTADTSISLGTSITLEATGGSTYGWTPPDNLDNAVSATPIATPLANTTYTVTVFDDNLCSDSAQVIVSVVEDFFLEVTNLLTPNGDGFNDTWHIGNIENYPTSNVQIFNRYGMVVYSAGGYMNDWGGTHKGKVLPDGTYYYVITFDGSDVQYKGGVTILKKTE